MGSSNLGWLGIAALGVTLPIHSANAAEPVPAANNSADEIIVTARKRTESVQDVPAAITVVGGDTLSQIHAVGYDDFVRLAPGLVIGDTGFGSMQNFTIRGISTGTGPQVLQSGVALYVDDFPTRDPYIPFGTLDLHLADINRVEVLRGPQGTLFGSGSLAGAVRVITRKPQTGSFSAELETSVEGVSGGQTRPSFEGIVNIPVGETVAFRAVGYHRSKLGYIDNVGRSMRNVNSGTIDGGRMAIAIGLSDRLKMTTSLIYQEHDSNDGEKSFQNAAAGAPRTWSALSADTRHGNAKLANVLLEYDVGPATISSSSMYLKTKYGLSYNVDGLSNVLGFILNIPAAFGTASSLNITSDSKAFTNDFKIASNGDHAISYVAGLYYSNWDNHAITDASNAVVSPILPFPISHGDIDSNVQETAVYGEVSYKPGRSFELSAGLRYSHNKFTGLSIASGLLRNTNVSDNVKQNSTTPRVTATWHPTETINVYAQAARGFRIGQSNFGVVGAPAFFKPDKLWNYEVGLKSTFLNGRGTFNAAVYYIDWQDLQVSLVAPDGFSVYTDNAGGARSQGIEVEASYNFTRHLNLRTSFSIGDAQLTEDVPTLTQPSGVVGVLKGDKLPGTPDFTIANSIEYNGNINESHPFYVRLDHQYVGSSQTSYSNVNSYKLGDYHLLGLSIGVEIGSGVTLSAYGKNLTNSTGTSNVLYDLFGGPAQAVRVSPRTLGFSIRKQF